MTDSSRPADFNVPFPVLTYRPFQQRNTTTSEDYEDSETRTEDDDDGGILTPTTTQAHESGLDDLPPTYEQAQAQSLPRMTTPTRPTERTSQSLHRPPEAIPAAPPTDRFPDMNAASTWIDAVEERSHTASVSPEYLQPARILESVCVAIPQLVRSKRSVQFARAYSLKLSNLGLPSTGFCSFIDGLNVILQSDPDGTTSRQALLSLADPIDDVQTPIAAKLGGYLRQANAHLFVPRGLNVSVQTVTDLVESLIPEDHGYRQARVKTRKALWDAKGEKEAAAGLSPRAESLTWSAPILATQGNTGLGPSHAASPSWWNSSKSELRTAQCPWEAAEPGVDFPDKLNTPVPDWYNPRETPSNDVFNPSSPSHDSQTNQRTVHSAQALDSILDDSGTDSDASTYSNTESRIHSHNSLAEAHRHYASVVTGIERTARDKIFGLGDSPRYRDLVKYEYKRFSKLNYAAVARHSAEIQYSTATLQRRQRRANKWLERELKTPDVKAIEARRQHSRRLEREAARHADRTKRASEQLAHTLEDTARDQHEAAKGHAKGRGKLAWEVWLVVRNVQT